MEKKEEEKEEESEEKMNKKKKKKKKNRPPSDWHDRRGYCADSNTGQCLNARKFLLRRRRRRSDLPLIDMIVGDTAQTRIHDNA